MIEACGALPGAGATELEFLAHQACASHYVGVLLEALTPGAEFVAALPVLALLVVAGIGWRVGTGF